MTKIKSRKLSWNKRRELLMQISHAESEAEVLISNLSDLQSAFYFSKAKVQDFLTSSIKMEEMNKDVLELVDDFNKKMSLKKVESTQLDDKLYDLQVTSDQTSQDTKLKVAQIKSQIDQKALDCLDYENLLEEANFEEFQQSGKRNSLLKTLHEVGEEGKNLKFKVLGRDNYYSKEIQIAESKLENEKANMGKRIKNLTEMNETIANSQKRLLEVENMKVSKCNILEDKKHSKALKEKELRTLLENLEEEGKRVDHLQQETAVKDKVDQDLVMLKEDIEVVQGRNTKLEKDLVKFSKVRQQNAECEQEKVNLLARIELLKNKNRNYSGDLKGNKDLLVDGNRNFV